MVLVWKCRSCLSKNIKVTFNDGELSLNGNVDADGASNPSEGSGTGFLVFSL